MISNEVDSSDISPSDFAAWLDGYQSDPTLTAFSAVAGPPNGLLPCAGYLSGIVAEPAPDYNDAVTRTNGLHLSICDMDMSQILRALAIGTSGLDTAWAPTFVPSDPSLIEVFVDSVLVPHSTVDGVDYVASFNAIGFHGSAVAPAGATIEGHYPAEVTCPN